MSVWSTLLFLICLYPFALEESPQESKPVKSSESEAGQKVASEAKSKDKDKEKATDEDEFVEDELDEIDRSKQEPRLSNKWFRGNYLIYDCDSAHFACVNQSSFIKCENQRSERIGDKNPQLGCTPLKKFKTQKRCFKAQYEKLHNQVPKIFCLHPDLR